MHKEDVSFPPPEYMTSEVRTFYECQCIPPPQHTHTHTHFDSKQKIQTMVWTILEALIHLGTQSDDLISCYRKPVGRTYGLLAYPLIDFIGPLHWFPQATDRIIGLRPKVGWGLELDRSRWVTRLKAKPGCA